MPSFHDLGKATANCAFSSEVLSKSKVLISGPFDNSTWFGPSAPFVVLGYIATAGTQIVSLPAILTADEPDFKVPVPFGSTLRSTFVSSPVAERVGPFPVAAFVTVTSFTADAVSENFNNSKLPSPIAFPLTSN